MGRTTQALIQKDSTFTLSSTISNCDVALDFSSPAALSSLLDQCLESKKPVVIGTTGYGEKEKQMLENASKYIPLFYTSNFCLGIALLQEIVHTLSQKLGTLASIDIIEAHHAHKKDRPSGTALSLSEAAGSSATIHSIRAGDIAGEHTILFALEGERLELKHQVHSRDAFAKGALQAVQFLKSQPPGYYTMKELLYAAC